MKQIISCWSSAAGGWRVLLKVLRHHIPHWELRTDGPYLQGDSAPAAAEPDFTLVQPCIQGCQNFKRAQKRDQVALTCSSFWIRFEAIRGPNQVAACFFSQRLEMPPTEAVSLTSIVSQQIWESCLASWNRSAKVLDAGAGQWHVQHA